MKQPFSNLEQFLKKFKGIMPRERLVREGFQLVLKKRFNIDLEREAIKVNKKTVFLYCSPILKQEIQLKKEQILQEINSQIGENVITEII